MAGYTMDGPKNQMQPLSRADGEGSIERKGDVTFFEMELLCRYWAGQFRTVIEDYLHSVVWDEPADTQMMYHAQSRLAYFQQFLGKTKVRGILMDAFKHLGDESGVAQP